MKKNVCETLNKPVVFQTSREGKFELAAGVRWTRRSFVQTLGGLGAASALLPFSWNSEGAETSATSSVWHFAGDSRPRYRAVSWWLTFEDLAWPNKGLMD